VFAVPRNLLLILSEKRNFRGGTKTENKQGRWHKIPQNGNHLLSGSSGAVLPVGAAVKGVGTTGTRKPFCR